MSQSFFFSMALVLGLIIKKILIKKHLKTTKERKGGIVDKENFVHLSNLKLDQKQDKKKAVKK